MSPLGLLTDEVAAGPGLAAPDAGGNGVGKGEMVVDVPVDLLSQ